MKIIDYSLTKRSSSKVGKKSMFAPLLALANIGILAVIVFYFTTKTCISLVEIWQLIVSMCYLNTLCISIKVRGAFDAVSVMLYLFFLFLLSNVVFDLVNFASMRESTIHLYYEISDETLITIMQIMTLFLGVVLFAVCTFPNRTNKKIELSNNEKLEKTTQWMVCILGPLAIFGNILDAASFSLDSSAYTESYVEDSSTSVLSLIEIIFRCLIPVYLVSMPIRNTKKICFTVIVLYIMSTAFGGSRAHALLPLMFLLWYYTKTGHKFTKSQILCGFILLFVLMTCVVFMRGSAASWNIFHQISSDNATMIMIANVLDYGYLIEGPHGNLFFLNAFINPILRYLICPSCFTGGRNEVYADTSFSLDHKIMYAINPEAFAEGRGFGSSALIEFYLFGGFVGLCIMSYIYLRLTQYLESATLKSPVAFMFFYWWFQAFIFSSRGTSLPSLFNIVVSFAIFLFILVMIKQPKTEAKVSTTN